MNDLINIKHNHTLLSSAILLVVVFSVFSALAAGRVYVVMQVDYLKSLDYCSLVKLL
jgi:hypothetical protein